MKLFTSLIALLFSLLFSSSASSFENFTNWLSPYPAGCITISSMQTALYPDTIGLLHDRDIFVDSPSDFGSPVKTRLTIFRTGCADDNRSALFVRLEVLDDSDPEVLDDSDPVFTSGLVPEFKARIGSTDYPLRPTDEPNSWVNNATANLIVETRSFVYVLDTPTPRSTGWDADRWILTSQYNDAFTLVIVNPLSRTEYTFAIPAYRNELQPTYLPLNGRLSGIWGVAGAEDQGFLISFSERIRTPFGGLIFFSWYTFDVSGNNVWLVGNANYEDGDGSVSFNLELVTDGQFMGSKRASRTPAGSVTITARNCNHLEFNFDLRTIGLSQGTRAVTRLFGLETAGYSCREIEDRFAD